MVKKVITRPAPALRAPSERAIKAEILLALGQRDDMMIWNNPIGVATPIGSSRTVKFGVAGAADIIGVWRQHVVQQRVVNEHGYQPLTRLDQLTYGQAIAIETKTAKGKQRASQEAFQARWEQCGGLYILARSVEDVVSALRAFQYN